MSSDEVANNSRTCSKNYDKLCSWTSEGKKSYLEADFEVTNIEQAFATTQMRLIDSFNLSTHGAKTDFVWERDICLTEHCAKQIPTRYLFFSKKILSFKKKFSLF